MQASNKNQMSSLESNHSSNSVEEKKFKNRITDKKMSNLLEALEECSENLSKQRTKTIVLLRKKKSLQYRKKSEKQIMNETIKPTDAIPRIFSDSKPISAGNPFLSQKSRAKILFSDRVFTKKPNIVSGIYVKNVLPTSKEQQKDWVNRKFQDYDLTVTEQMGNFKRFLKKKHDLEAPMPIKKSICSGKLPSKLFSTFERDNNNFYFDANSTSSGILTKSKFKTKATLDSEGSQNEPSKLKKAFISGQMMISKRHHTTKS